MAPEHMRAHARRVSRWSAIALGASIPVSTALDNVLIVITLTAWALSGQIRETLKLAIVNKVALFAIALFLLLAIGVAYGEASWQKAERPMSQSWTRPSVAQGKLHFGPASAQGKLHLARFLFNLHP